MNLTEKSMACKIDISLGMDKRLKIGVIAWYAFKNGIEEVEELHAEDRLYIMKLGEKAVENFYLHIQALNNQKRFPRSNLNAYLKAR
jgi:hypothetical protein